MTSIALGMCNGQHHDCLMFGDKGYLCAEVQKNLFGIAQIELEVP